MKIEPKPESVTESKALTRYSPDELRDLYKKDPKRFDELANDALSQACIGRTPEQTLKFRQMQWSIDAQLRKAKTPVARMQVMENIFYSQVFGEHGELAHLMEECTQLIRIAVGAKEVVGNEQVLEQVPARPALYLVKK